MSGKTISFYLDRNPTNGAAGATSLPGVSGTWQWIGSGSTTASGVATASADTTGWQPGMYEILAYFEGTTGCFRSYDMATLTAATAGDSAQGGGWYTDNGRTNFGFTINRVPNSDPVEYKGQFLLIYKNKWRLKGTLSNYVVNTSTLCGSAEGVGKLSEWVLLDAGSPSTTLDDVYGWVVRAEGVPYAIGFCDRNNGGSKKGGTTLRDLFGIEISYAGSGLPSNTISSKLELKGGDISIKTK